jgi:hypothetical protein
MVRVVLIMVVVPVEGLGRQEEQMAAGTVEMGDKLTLQAQVYFMQEEGLEVQVELLEETVGVVQQVDGVQVANQGPSIQEAVEVVLMLRARVVEAQEVLVLSSYDIRILRNCQI